MAPSLFNLPLLFAHFHYSKWTPSTEFVITDSEFGKCWTDPQMLYLWSRIRRGGGRLEAHSNCSFPLGCRLLSLTCLTVCPFSLQYRDPPPLNSWSQIQNLRSSEQIIKCCICDLYSSVKMKGSKWTPSTEFVITDSEFGKCWTDPQMLYLWSRIRRGGGRLEAHSNCSFPLGCRLLSLTCLTVCPFPKGRETWIWFECK